MDLHSVRMFNSYVGPVFSESCSVIEESCEHRFSDKKEKRVILIYVPYPSLKASQKLHYKIVSEIQKRKNVQAFITAKRTINSKWIKIHKSQTRPRNRCLTSVFDSILEDLIVPGNVTARRIRHKL